MLKCARGFHKYLHARKIAGTEQVHLPIHEPPVEDSGDSASQISGYSSQIHAVLTWLGPWGNLGLRIATVSSVCTSKALQLTAQGQEEKVLTDGHSGQFFAVVRIEGH